VQYPCNPLIEDYTEIFYVIDEGDIPSIQCKMSLRGPKFMTVDSQLTVLLITSRYRLHRKHRSSVAVFVCKAAAQYWLFYLAVVAQQRVYMPQYVQ
jgi:hypothetical protein